MSRATGLVASFLLVCAALTAGAQGVSVTYVAGDADAKTGAAWSPLAVGNNLTADTFVRLDAGALVQLRGGGMDFTLNRPGTYLVRTLMAARKATTSIGVGTAIVKALRYLAMGPTEKQNATLGARGADQSRSGDEDDWVDSSADALLKAGKDLVTAGSWDRAIPVLTNALESADSDEKPQIRYYLAYANAMAGQSADAWKQIEDLTAGPADPWAGDYVLLRARLLVDSSAYGEAVSWLGEESHDLSRDARRAPLYFFILGLARRGYGDTAGARQAMTQLASIAPDSDLVAASAELMRGW